MEPTSSMCGIAGVLYREPDRPTARPVLEAMGQAIAHRGPDGEGFWLEPGLGLVHRRLAIIDLEGGQQPLGNEDDSIQVVFHGEIYNYQELTAWLESLGHRFRTRSDTEVLVHLYEEEGDRLVERLRGMFAFAIWDARRRQLLLARDRVGIKPLYVYRDHDKLLFGSEIKAILAHPDLLLSLDPQALEEYLAFGMVLGPRSIFRQVEKLPPASVWIVEAGRWSHPPRCFWQFRAQPDESLSVADWQEAIQAKLAESVRLHLIADVPVGAFLSGGMDSSIIVACSAGATRGALQTFSMGFLEESFSELPYAREVARQYQTSHVEQVVTPDAVSLLDELSLHYDEPFADSSAVPTFLVSKLAARNVKVVLSGDGGDEGFGGYRRYAHDLKEAALRRWLPRWLRGALSPVARHWPKADWLPRPLRLKTLLTNLSLDPGPAYANTLQVCRLPLRRRLLDGDLSRQLNGHDPGEAVASAFGTVGPDDALAGMIHADLLTLLPDDYLVKVDRASMACGLEVRPPLLDHELLELTARIPSRLKIRDGKKLEGFPAPLSCLQRTRLCLDNTMTAGIPIWIFLGHPILGDASIALRTSGPPAGKRHAPPQAGLRDAGQRLVPRPAASALSRGCPRSRLPAERVGRSWRRRPALPGAPARAGPARPHSECLGRPVSASLHRDLGGVIGDFTRSSDFAEISGTTTDSDSSNRRCTPASCVNQPRESSTKADDDRKIEPVRSGHCRPSPRPMTVCRHFALPLPHPCLTPMRPRLCDSCQPAISDLSRHSCPVDQGRCVPVKTQEGFPERMPRPVSVLVAFTPDVVFRNGVQRCTPLSRYWPAIVRPSSNR
jgi:asparagine synthase (glutamine-hydrolysing)